MADNQNKSISGMYRPAAPNVQSDPAATGSTAITVSDPMPQLAFEVTEAARKRFGAPKLQFLALLPQSHRTVWLAGFSPLLSPNVRTTRCPKGIMFALGNLAPEELARAVPIMLLDKPLCLHFTKYGSCSRLGCKETCSHRDEIQVKTLIAYRYMQLQEASKADVKRMVQETLKKEGIEESCQIPKRFIYYKDANLDEAGDDGVVGEGGYTEAGQRRMRTEEEGDEILDGDNDDNLLFENDEAREAFIEERAKEHESRRRRLLDAAKFNAKNLPPLPVLPPDVESWWNEKKVFDEYYQAQGMPPVASTTLMALEKQGQRDPAELFPPLPNISFAARSKALSGVSNNLHRDAHADAAKTLLELYSQGNANGGLQMAGSVVGGVGVGLQNSGPSSFMNQGNYHPQQNLLGSSYASSVAPPAMHNTHNNPINPHRGAINPVAAEMDEAMMMMSMFSQPLSTFTSTAPAPRPQQLHQQQLLHQQMPPSLPPSMMAMSMPPNFAHNNPSPMQMGSVGRTPNFYNNHNNNHNNSNNSNSNGNVTYQQPPQRPTYVCTNCGRQGHKTEYCRQLPNANGSGASGTFGPNNNQQQQQQYHPTQLPPRGAPGANQPESGNFGML